MDGYMKINPLSDIEFILPTVSTPTTDTDDAWTGPEYYDMMVLVYDYERCMKKGQFREAADAATQMIDLVKQYPAIFGHIYEWSGAATLYGKRATSLVFAKDYNAALDDLQRISKYAPLSEECELDVAAGLIHLLQGRDGGCLEKSAARSNPLALLLLNAPESQTPPDTVWFFLPDEEKMQKLLQGRHYAEAIQMIDEIDPNSGYWNDSLDDRWLALRGVCYALRGNLTQAAQDLTRANSHYFSEYRNELALVYAMAGQRDRALKMWKKNPETESMIGELVRQRIEQMVPA